MNELKKVNLPCRLSKNVKTSLEICKNQIIDTAKPSYAFD